MPREVPYGLNSMLRLDLGESLVADCAAPRGQACEDPIAAVLAALDAPLAAPPLSQAIVPGDRVVLALEPSLPAAPQIVAAVVRYLSQCGVEAASVTILHGRGESGDMLAQFPGNPDEQPKLVAHDPDDRGQMAYLAADEAGEPVYLNRALCDADVVIPIGCLRVLPADQEPNANRTLYPAFSTTRRQHQAERGAAAPRGGRASSTAVAEPEVAWLLGVQYTVQVLPGPGGSVMQVFAGQPAEVLEAGQRAAAKAWRFPVARRASLVVAAIEGDASQQTWQHIGRALAAATDVVAEGGAIALCCDLQDAPGPAVERLTQIEDRHAALRSIRKEHLADGVVANQLARAQEQASVYFLSRLDEELLEQLGIAAVADAAEVARLLRRHSSCIVLSNAQNAVDVADED